MDDNLFLQNQLDFDDAIKVVNYVNSKIHTHLNEMCNKYKSHHKLNFFSKVFYFENFYIVSSFNKSFVFAGSIELERLKILFDIERDWGIFVNQKAIALILNNKLVDNEDFQNLKKCHMLNQKIDYEEEKVHCKFSPYYLVELELFGDILNITVKANNIQYILEISKIGDLKEYIINTFSENSAQIDESILNYYARNY